MSESFIKTKWKEYARGKRFFSIFFDFFTLSLLILMLIPTTRDAISIFSIRSTLLAPRETKKIIFLSDDDWDFMLKDSANNEFPLSDFDIGKPLFVNYFATWCKPSIAELPSIQRTYNKFKDRVNFVFISNEPHEVVAAFMQKHKYDFPIFTIAEEAPIIFTATSLPTTYLIDDDRLVLMKSGAARWDSKRFMKTLYKLLNEQ